MPIGPHFMRAYKIKIVPSQVPYILDKELQMHHGPALFLYA
jgi:hypothetical protein